MNIVTISSFDDWARTHCVRLVTSARRYMPDATYYGVMTRPPAWEEKHTLLEDYLKRYVFDHVMFVDYEPVGHQFLFYDRLRALLPDLLGLEECLYIDPDVDILGDLTHVQSLHPEADLMSIPVAGLPSYFAQHLRRYPSNYPLSEIGFMYIRKSNGRDFDTLMNANLVDRNSQIAGTLLWYELKKVINHKLLPAGLQATRQRPDLFTTASAIHYNGPAKDWRPYLRWTDNPRQIYFAGTELWDVSDMNNEQETISGEVNEEINQIQDRG